MIYLASPYMDPDSSVVEQRFDAVCRKAGELIKEGHVVYSPIAHSHPIAIRVALPQDWAFWERFDTAMLKCATAFYILKLPGWDRSKGVASEEYIARSMGIPVTYLDA